MINALINDQKELTLIIKEKYNGNFLISSYALPMGLKKFKREELQVTYTMVLVQRQKYQIPDNTW